MSHTERADKQFEEWWQHTGLGIIRQATFYPSQEVLKALCRVAYFQGRIDENLKTADQVGQMLQERQP